jgi:hypothetical protein
MKRGRKKILEETPAMMLANLRKLRSEFRKEGKSSSVKWLTDAIARFIKKHPSAVAPLSIKTKKKTLSSKQTGRKTSLLK